ncbi:alpha/beta hydrolase family protein [Ceratobasidium sp. AG-Ba]|nr:alpha/beta hydrolase family protein [Ceratobasidium sp. AG-Ba]
MSYAKPITPTPPGTATPRTLLPFSNTQSVEPPVVRFAKRDFVHDWVCSTHVIQAASPRESPAVKTSTVLTTKPLPVESTKAERQAAVDMKYAQIMEQRNAIAAGVKLAPDETPMWITVNRYAPARVPSDSPGVTLIVAHATGFHKEIWDTTFRFIISSLQRNARTSDIAEIWALDAANHGDSALLNEGKIGDIYEWSDHTRDIANFIINYLPESPMECKDNLLPLVTKSVSLQRMSNGFSSRTIIGLGHSFGGCTLMRAALHLPHLFSGVILIDPIIYPTYARREEGVGKLAKGALGRRDRWPDVNAAKSGLLKSPFFQAWHPDVFSDYMKYGLYESEGMVKLKCSGYQEGVTFAEHGRLPNEVWEMLPSFDERIPLRWLMDSKAALSTAGEEITQHTVWRRPKNSSNARIQGAGHLIPQEAPERLAHEVVDFIQQIVDARGIKPRL